RAAAAGAIREVGPDSAPANPAALGRGRGRVALMGMQPDRFTVKSQEAVAAAQRLAAARRNTEVAPPHLLLALLDQEDGLVVPVLQRLDANVAAIRAAAATAIGGL